MIGYDQVQVQEDGDIIAMATTRMSQAIVTGSIEMIDGTPAYGNTLGLDLLKNHTAVMRVYPPT